MNIDLHYTRRYKKNGKVAHLIAIGDLDQVYPNARCGEWQGFDGDWWGTGSQDEEDKIKELRDCGLCLRFLERDRIAREKVERQLEAFRNAR